MEVLLSQESQLIGGYPGLALSAAFMVLLPVILVPAGDFFLFRLFPLLFLGDFVCPGDCGIPVLIRSLVLLCHEFLPFEQTGMRAPERLQYQKVVRPSVALQIASVTFRARLS